MSITAGLAGRDVTMSGDLADLIGQLYDAAAEPARWRDFLEAGAGYFGAFSANFIHYDAARPERSVAFLTGYENLPAEIRGQAMRTLIASQGDDPRVDYSFRHPSKPFHCRQIVSTAELQATASYRTMLKPHGVEYSLMVTLSDDPSLFTGLGFLRGPRHEAFTQREVDDLGRLVPHLHRAMMIQDRLGQLEHGQQTSWQVLENLPTGIVIARPGGAVDYANAAARAITDGGDGLSIGAGHLRLARAPDRQALLEALQATADTGEYRAVALERPSGRAAFRCVISRLWQVGDGLPNLLAAPRVAIYISDPELALEVPAELLQRLFGLTPGEARLVEAIVAGSSLAEAAESLGIRESTARDRLKGVFRKTGARSQTELVRAVLASPVWLRGGGVPPPLTLGD